MGKVFVTGIGITTAIGNDRQENLDSLRKAKPGIGRAVYFDSAYAGQLPFGEVKASNEALAAALRIGANEGFTRTDLLAAGAFEEAVRDAGLSPAEVSAFDTAFISASTVGGMCLTDQLYEDANLRSGKGSVYLDAYSCGAHTLKIARKHHLKGYTDTINTACSSSANAIMMGMRLIKSGRAARAVVGGADSLAKYTVNGFNALKIVSTEPCKPFDRNRSGLNLGEGAAYLVLEAAEDCGDKFVYAEISGYGNANDAYHPSSLSEDAVGVIRCMKEALASAGLSPAQIDYINTHGTATDNNDATELTGMLALFDPVPPFNSTKSYTGHTLGAAGAVEAIFSIFSIQYGEIYPSLHVSDPMLPDGPLPETRLRRNADIRHVLSNSFGFGGNCTSLVITKA